MAHARRRPAAQDATRLAAVRLGQLFREHRRAAGITMAAAAEAAGISRVTWHRLEKGEPSVAVGSWLAALAVLGLRADLVPASQPEPPVSQAPEPTGSLPLQIRPEDYPQLRQLAWQVHGLGALTPREALGIYERNWRHLDEGALEPRERKLIDALRQVFASGGGDV